MSWMKEKIFWKISSEPPLKHNIVHRKRLAWGRDESYFLVDSHIPAFTCLEHL